MKIFEIKIKRNDRDLFNVHGEISKGLKKYLLISDISFVKK
jgi:hypothetical protein